MPVSVLNRLPAKCFLTGPRRRKSLGPILPTGLVPSYGVVAPGEWGLDYPAYSPCLVRSLRLRRRQRRTRCHLLATDNDFLYARIRVLVPRWHKCLNFNGDSIELWCVPSATRCPYMHRRENISFYFLEHIQSKTECTFSLLCYCVIFIPAFIGQYRMFPDSSLVINLRFHLMLQNHVVVVVVAVRLAVLSQVSNVQTQKLSKDDGGVEFCFLADRTCSCGLVG
jgi:hypothetical protein